MPSSDVFQRMKSGFDRRILSLLFVVASTLLFVVFFAGSGFSSNLDAGDGLLKLDVSRVEKGTSVESPVNIPDAWIGGLQQGATVRHYQVRLPVGAAFADHSLYVSAYRQTIEVRLQGRLIASGGNKKIIWLNPYPKPLLVSLVPFGEFSSETEQVVIDIEVRSSETGEGGISSVWYGSHKEINDAQPFYVSFMSPMLHANIGILAALVLFLAIDSLRSRDSRLKLVMILPHLSYALLCLPEIEFLSTVTWLKLYQVSINSIVLVWIYVGHQALGLFRPWLRWPIASIVLISLPALVINDYENLKIWVYDIQNPIIGIVGIALFLRVGWCTPESKNLRLHVILLVAGAALTAAGLHDISLNIAGNKELKVLVLPLAVVMVSIIILVWTALEMLQRNRQLTRQQERMKELFDSRTTALGEAKSQLMQHQRYQALNTMGAAISHEIKNPLAALNNDLALMDMKLKSANEIDLPIRRMQRTLQRIDNTVTELTDFSRRQTIQREITDLSAWMYQLSTSPEILALMGDIAFEVEIEPTIEAQIDEGLMRRALVNVLDNSVGALRQTELPEVQLVVRSNEQTQQVEISVHDNGEGLSTDNVEELFEPLVSGSKSGLGLGLAIVRDIMVLHLGEVKLKKKKSGAGTTVSLAFPMA